MAKSQENQSYRHGFLKQVLSGDAVVIRGPPKNGPPPEQTLYFSNVAAPKLAKRLPGKNEYTDEEPYAWESREFLRRKVLGAAVIFTVETETNSGRSYGTLYLGTDIKTAVNITRLMLTEGWVKTRMEGRVDAELQKLEEEARSKKAGMFAGNDQEHIRKVKWTIDDMQAFLKENKGKPLRAIIEHVRDGSTIKAFLIPDFQHISLMISGIRCPVVKYDSEGRADMKTSEQYACFAKYNIETKILQKEVEVFLESVSNNNFLGSVIHRTGGNVAEAMLKEGFARCVDWSIANVTGGAEPLRKAEKHAKENKLRIWSSFKPTKSTAPSQKAIVGTVCEIANGDAFFIREGSSEPKKIFLASIRPPRQEQPPQPKQGQISRPLYEVPWLFEAREFLRKKLIGQTVTANIDYIQPASGTFPQKTCCTVVFEKENIGEALVREGLATVVKYRQDDDQRASNYDDLMLAESNATSDAKGLFAPKKEVPTHRVKDLSSDPVKAKSHLPFLVRSGMMDAIVEFVASGSRLRLFVPKDSCLITFLLSGITCPRGTRPSPTGGGMIEGEAFGNEAMEFTKSLALHRNVQIEVESIDRGGNYIGWLHVDGKNVSCLLVENGLSTVHNTAETSKYYSHLTTAELKAKNKSLKLWSDPSLHKVEQKVEVSLERKVDPKQMMISEVTREGRLYGQYCSEGPALVTLMENLRKDLADNPPAPGPFKPSKGSLCAAKFTDGNWYRAKVERIQSGKVFIFYVDYGNREVTTASQLTLLPARFISSPHYAHEMSLALVKFSKDEDHLEDGVAGLMSEVVDKVVDVNVEYKVSGINFVTITRPDTKKDVTIELLKQGLVMVERTRERRYQSMVKEYLEAEDVARKAHLNIFQYGDAREDDAAEFGMER